MKLAITNTVKIRATDIPSLDPIDIYLEEYESGDAVGKFWRGEIIVKCFDKSWTAFWGNMGEPLLDFVIGTNNSYLVNCLDRGISSMVVCYGDNQALREDAIKRIEEMPDIYLDELNGVTRESLLARVPELEWEGRDNIIPDDLVSRIYSDFWYERPPMMSNHKYEYLDRICTAVREALIEYKATTNTPEWIQKRLVKENS